MKANDAIRLLHNLSVDLELSGRINESKACAYAVATLMIMKPADFEMVTPTPVDNLFESEHHKAFMRVVDDIMGSN